MSMTSVLDMTDPRSIRTYSLQIALRWNDSQHPPERVVQAAGLFERFIVAGTLPAEVSLLPRSVPEAPRGSAEAPRLSA